MTIKEKVYVALRWTQRWELGRTLFAGVLNKWSAFWAAEAPWTCQQCGQPIYVDDLSTMRHDGAMFHRECR
jgi:hypothetical protein